MQVLALEAFAQRAEKLLQLLAELGRRLQLRLANAVHHPQSAPTASASPDVKQGSPFLVTAAPQQTTAA